MTKFAEAAHAKGWTLKELGERWGIGRRQMSNIAKAPKPVHWDALASLADFKGESA